MVNIDNTLVIIKQIESNNCKDVKHKSDAKGCYGMRPMALKDIGVKNPHFSYSEVVQTVHAKMYAKRILSYTKSPSVEFLLYGWLMGPTAASKRQKAFNYGKIPYRKPFENNWYIKRYDKLNKKLLSAEQLLFQ